MANRRDSNRLSTLSELIENAVGAYPQRIQAVEFASEGISSERLALEQTKRILDGVDKRPIEDEKIASRSTRKNESRQ